MSLDITVLGAIFKLGVATYTNLETETGENRNKLRWRCNELKARQLIKQTEDPVENEVAWKLTEQGKKHLEDQKAKAESLVSAGSKAKPKKKPVAKATQDTSEERVRPQRTEGLISSAARNRQTPSGKPGPTTEVRAVVETQAAGHAAETAGEATTATVEPAASDVTKNSPYVVEIIPTTRYTIKTTDGLIEDLEKASVWNGFTELRNQLGQKLIIAEHSPNAVSEYLSSVLTPNKKKEADKAVVISGTPALISKLFQQREAA